MEDKFIRNTSLLLCFAAGFCDTLTFVAAREIFSAHVTGNFIVFAYDMIKHADRQGWQKLITFPVFVFAVMLGTRLASRSTKVYLLLSIEGGLLLLTALSSLILQNLGWQLQLQVMIIVVAMAFQNTFGKLNAKATYGLTTVMTGNVTQASIDFIKGIIPGATPEASVRLKKQVILIVGFLAGCLAGALLGKSYGLFSAILPGLMLLIWLGMNHLFSMQSR